MDSKLLCHLIEPQEAINIDNCSVATVQRLSCVRAKGKIKKTWLDCYNVQIKKNLLYKDSGTVINYVLITVNYNI